MAVKDLDINNAEDHFVKPPENMKRFFEGHEALKVTKLHTREYGDNRSNFIPDNIVDKPSAKVVLGYIMTALDISDKILTPDGLKEKSDVERSYSPAILAKKLEGYLKENGKALTPQGEFVDWDTLQNEDPNGTFED